MIRHPEFLRIAWTDEATFLFLKFILVEKQKSFIEAMCDHHHI